ncbi:MAG: glycosyltransferase family 39 protein [Bacteroidota bacterium]|nr:glycosyltransferase family 39 protein [Bacteroidota bacterium]
MSASKSGSNNAQFEKERSHNQPGYVPTLRIVDQYQHRSPIRRGELFGYIALGIFLLLYLVVRTLTVQPTGDESVTFFWYMRFGHVLLPYPHVDANNHLLITFIGHLLYPLTGDSIWTMRLPSLMFFPVMLVYAFLWGSRIPETSRRWSWYLFILCTPFILEFFALGRGYGPSLALLIGGIYHLQRGTENRSSIDLWIGYLILFLACLANLNILPVFGLSIFITTLTGRLSGWRTPRAWLPALPALVGVGLLGTYGLFLKDEGLLYYGTSNWIDHSIPSMGVLLIPGHSFLGSFWIWTGVFTSLFIVLANVKRISIARVAADLPTLTLYGTVIFLSVSLIHSKAPLPLDRTGLHLLILLAMALSGGSQSHSNIPQGITAITTVLLAIPGILLIAHLNGTHSLVWSYQYIPKKWVEEFRPLEGKFPETFSGYRFKQAGLQAIGYFYQLDLPSVNPDEQDTLSTWKILEEPGDYGKFQKVYGVVDEDPISESLLLRRRHPIARSLIRSEELFLDVPQDKRFIPLLVDTVQLGGKGGLEIQVEIDGLTYFEQDLDLVIQVIGNEDEDIYASIPLDRSIPPYNPSGIRRFSLYRSTGQIQWAEIRVHLFNPLLGEVIPGRIHTRLIRLRRTSEIDNLQTNPEINGT